MRTHHAPHHTRRARRCGGLGTRPRRGRCPAQAAPRIPLNNGQETTGAEGGAHGFFTYEIDGDELCYTLEVDRLTVPAVAAHIHVGHRKVAGPVVIPLAVGAGTSFEVGACITADPALLAAIEAESARLLRQRPHADVPRWRGARAAQVADRGGSGGARLHGAAGILYTERSLFPT